MKWLWVGAAAFVAAIASSATPSQAQEAPFEPVPESLRARPVTVPEVSGFDPLGDLALSAIHFYQRDMRDKSISRCPYRVSCSRFAVREIQRHGFIIGLAYFLDRFFYRENEEAMQHYPTVVMPDGSLKLDDGLSGDR